MSNVHWQAWLYRGELARRPGPKGKNQGASGGPSQAMATTQPKGHKAGEQLRARHSRGVRAKVYAYTRICVSNGVRGAVGRRTQLLRPESRRSNSGPRSARGFVLHRSNGTASTLPRACSSEPGIHAYIFAITGLPSTGAGHIHPPGWPGTGQEGDDPSRMAVGLSGKLSGAPTVTPNRMARARRTRPAFI